MKSYSRVGGSSIQWLSLQKGKFEHRRAPLGTGRATSQGPPRSRETGQLHPSHPAFRGLQPWQTGTSSVQHGAAINSCCLSCHFCGLSLWRLQQLTQSRAQWALPRHWLPLPSSLPSPLPAPLLAGTYQQVTCHEITSVHRGIRRAQYKVCTE